MRFHHISNRIESLHCLRQSFEVQGGRSIDLKSILRLGNKVIGADLGLSVKELQAMTQEDIDTRVDEAMPKLHSNLTPDSEFYCDAADLRNFVLHFNTCCMTGTEQMVFDGTACLLPVKIDGELIV